MVPTKSTIRQPRQLADGISSAQKRSREFAQIGSTRQRRGRSAMTGGIPLGITTETSRQTQLFNGIASIASKRARNPETTSAASDSVMVMTDDNQDENCPPTVSTACTAGMTIRKSKTGDEFSPLSALTLWLQASANTRMNKFVTLGNDRELLKNVPLTTCLRYDSAAYGQDWLLYHRAREDYFQPWQHTLSGPVEKHRLQVISMYWSSMKRYSVSPATVFVAVNNFGRLLSTWSPSDFEKLSKGRWAQTAMVAYRLAFKLEERPEVMWEVNNFWNIFPAFDTWEFDRSEENMNKIEIGALHLLKDSMDIPLAAMFFSLYLSAGGWPDDVCIEYRNLGLYLLALATFTTTKDTLLHHVAPSCLAAAALVLGIKIINGDRCCIGGMLKHLPSCKLSTPQRGEIPLSTFVESENIDVKETCLCRYEIFPRRLQEYSHLDLDRVQPAIRGLSYLLRNRPAEVSNEKGIFADFCTEGFLRQLGR